MQTSELNVITGAFGYTGKYITSRLLSMEKRVLNLTGHPDRHNQFGDQVGVAHFNFDRPGELVKSLTGATTLYNTYWVRFPYKNANYDSAVKNTLVLLKAAEEAGVRRIVHVSITNACKDSSLPYFKGKGLLEKSIVNSKLSHAIIRPTVIFGTEDILINNIAWILRNFPAFAIPGNGSYRLQPVFVEDMAEIAINAGQSEENMILDAVGPEIYTFDEMVRLIAAKVNSKAKIVHLAPKIALSLSKIVGRMLNDVLLTRDEVEGLMANLLVSDKPPTGKTRLSDWLSDNRAKVGVKYSSELGRHYR